MAILANNLTADRVLRLTAGQYLSALQEVDEFRMGRKSDYGEAANPQQNFWIAVTYRNPAPTVDIIIEMRDRPHRPIVLIERHNEPFGWAIPGGFVDYGEAVETTAVREAQEETQLSVTLIEQFHVYSDPHRDPRKHTLSVVFLAYATGTPTAADDAKDIALFAPWEVPPNLCFDHHRILQDYWQYRHYGLRPRP